MQKRIKDSFGLWDWSGVADGLYGAIVEQGYVANGQINYRECGKFLDVKLDGKLHGYNKGLVSACEKVGETMDKTSGILRITCESNHPATCIFNYWHCAW